MSHQKMCARRKIGRHCSDMVGQFLCGRASLKLAIISGPLKSCDVYVAANLLRELLGNGRVGCGQRASTSKVPCMSVTIIGAKRDVESMILPGPGACRQL